MKNSFKHPINYTAALMAITSFGISCFCLLILKNSSDTGFFAIGYFYILLSTLGNMLLLLSLIVNAIRQFKDYKEHIKALLLVAINIPLVLLY